MNTVEPAVRQIWQELLEVDEVQPEDDFFLSGGHSILAARFTAALSSVLGKKVPVSVMFDHPQFEKFVEAVSALA